MATGFPDTKEVDVPRLQANRFSEGLGETDDKATPACTLPRSLLRVIGGA
jgi:hypothetical protein